MFSLHKEYKYGFHGIFLNLCLKNIIFFPFNLNAKYLITFHINIFSPIAFSSFMFI